MIRHSSSARGSPGRFSAICLAAVFLAAPLAAQTLTPAQMRAAAVVALDRGQPEVALEISAALLTRDPDDLLALLMQARTARDLGQFDIAMQAARRAWSLSETDGEKYDSARMMAQVLASQDQRTRAQFWLRRAVQHAPDTRSRQTAVQDFTYVRARNPWSTQLRFSLAPSSNINNGSARDETLIFDFFTQDYVVAGLGGAARALSGIEASLGVALRYRLSESADHRTDLVLRGDTRRYSLSDSAREAAPTAKAADFALDTLNLGVLHRWKAQNAPVEYQLGALVGATRYGGAAYSESLRLNAGFNRPLGQRTRMEFAVGADITRGPVAPHSDIVRLGFDLTHRHAAGHRLSASLTLSDSTSDSDSAEYREIRAGLETLPTWKILGAAPVFGIAFRLRDYPSFSIFSPDGRTDREVSAFLALSFNNAEFYGFTPTVTLSASRTDSSIGLFDTDRFGLQLGIQSAF